MLNRDREPPIEGFAPAAFATIAMVVSIVGFLLIALIAC
jgi:hypothetical protein|tara:strand:- start:540 stop:656 length:117 start_codon:yes stop_codon:yes gene_type:complete